MSPSIPLIRAGAAFPILRWMHEAGIDPDKYLAPVDLCWIDQTDPFKAIPVRSTAMLLRDLSRDFGPDAPWRIVGGLGFFELGLLTVLLKRSVTPRQVLSRTTELLPLHCSHETLEMIEGDDGICLREGWMLRFDSTETLHAVQQYCAAMVDSVLAVACPLTPAVRQLRMVPHPEFGFSHLKELLGSAVSEAPSGALEIRVTNGLADAPFPDLGSHEIPAMSLETVSPLRSERSLGGAVAVLLAQMIGQGKPSIDRVAFAAGTSRRSLQRQLDREGLVFSDILETVRCEEAERLMGAGQSFASIARALGYSDPASFTRGMKRWTGQTPMRQRAAQVSRSQVPGQAPR